jgi:hypothetical protein
MTRDVMPKRLKDDLLDEYDHRCAVCGGDRPHIHHIDENPNNNKLDNLLPLCPNCHLRDQHNPTRKIDIPKLKIFRKFKDPAILKPQFHPIYLRQSFLEEVDLSDDSIEDIEKSVNELVEFIRSLEMGAFYSKMLIELIGSPKGVGFMFFSGMEDDAYRDRLLKRNSDYRAKIVENRESVRNLLIELLRYQAWSNN